MNKFDLRIERIEDRLIPKEITSPYSSKTVSEKWLAEFRRMLEEHYQ